MNDWEIKMELMKGIVIKAIKYQENSKVLTILTEHGLISCLVRNANNYKSKNFAYSQEMTEIEFDLSKSKRNSFDTLTTGRVINNYSNIKLSYQKTSSAMIVLELINQFAEFIEDYQTLYNFTTSIFSLINNSNYEYLYSLIFKLKITYLLGIAPNFKHCNCDGSEFIGFSIKNGKMKCKKCYNDEKLEIGKIVEVLKVLYYMKISDMTEDVLEYANNMISLVEKFLTDYYQFHLDFISRSEKIIKKVTSNF